MRATTLMTVLVFIGLAAALHAAEVDKGMICTSVVERICEGAATEFPADVGRVYAFTRISGIADGSVTHRWVYRDKTMAEVSLPVKGAGWRTWSSKTIDPLWAGDWKVEVVNDSDGSVMDILEFSIMEAHSGTQ